MAGVSSVLGSGDFADTGDAAALRSGFGVLVGAAVVGVISMAAMAVVAMLARAVGPVGP